MSSQLYKDRALTLLFAFIIIFGLAFLPAQEDDMDEVEMDEVACKPENFLTPYDAMKVDTSQKQIAIWYQFANDYYKYKKYDEAIPNFWKVLVNDTTPKFRIVFSKLAECYYQKNEIDTTLLLLYRGLERYPDYTTLHFRAGQIENALNRTACAIPHYEALVELDNSDNERLSNYLRTLSKLYFDTGAEKSIEIQERVVELNPENAEDQARLVQLNEYFGRDMKDVLRATYEKTPTIENALKYAKLLYQEGDYQLAMAPLKVALDEDPKNIEAMTYAARCDEGLGNWRTAIDHYKNILQIDAKNVNTLCALALAYIEVSNFSTARSYALQASRIDPGFGLPYIVMGNIYESGVLHCSGKRDGNKGYSYDDKLAFEKAQAQYSLAKRDPSYKEQAERRASGLNPFRRTQEEKFLYNSRENITDSCYDWMK